MVKERKVWGGVSLKKVILSLDWECPKFQCNVRPSHGRPTVDVAQWELTGAGNKLSCKRLNNKN